MAVGINRPEIVWEFLCGLVRRDDIPAQREMTLECELAHAAGTAKIAQLLALKRGLDIETAFILGVLHDYARIFTGTKKNHAQLGGTFVKQYLDETGHFSEDEIEAIVKAVANHSFKDRVGSPLEELIKDADVLDGFLSGRKPEKLEAQARLLAVFTELQLQDK